MIARADAISVSGAGPSAAVTPHGRTGASLSSSSHDQFIAGPVPPAAGNERNFAGPFGQRRFWSGRFFLHSPQTVWPDPLVRRPATSATRVALVAGPFGQMTF